jgi:hypothetical protein
LATEQPHLYTRVATIYYYIYKHMAPHLTSSGFFGLDRKIAQLEFNKTIAGCYRDGNAEYEAVGVLLLTWKDDDMNCKDAEVLLP